MQADLLFEAVDNSPEEAVPMEGKEKWFVLREMVMGLNSQRIAHHIHAPSCQVWLKSKSNLLDQISRATCMGSTR